MSLEELELNNPALSSQSKRELLENEPGDSGKMNELSFEQRYEDVLQNIEFSIVRVYQGHPEMTDWEALTGIKALIHTYQAEAKGRETAPPPLDPLADEVYDFVETMCEWRMGREMPFHNEDGESVEFSPEPITLDEIIACLKRVRRSIKRWNRRSGRQGYLTFVSQFIK